MLTVENTNPDFAWLVNYFETIMSNVLWLPCTSATTASRMRTLMNRAAKLTGSPEEFVGWQGHDFSFRGMSGPEAASLGGRILFIANYIDNQYAQLSGKDAKYQLTRKLAAGMGTLFDPALANAANQAVMDVLVDPTIVVQQTIIEQEVPLRSLEVGMVLTRDIYSTPGILVLERGTRVTPQSLDSIRRHQLSIPLNTKAYIRK